MWLIEIAFAIGILIGTMVSVVVPDKKRLDKRYLVIPFIFVFCVVAAGDAYRQTGEFFGVANGFSHSVFLLAIFCAAFAAIITNVDRLRFPIDELLYVTQLAIASFLLLYITQGAYGYVPFLATVPIVAGLLIPLTILRAISKTGRLFFTVMYIVMSGSVFMLILLQIDLSGSLALLSTSAVDLAQAFLLGWIFVAYLVPVCMLGLIVFVAPDPRWWPDVGGNIYHYFVFTGRHHGVTLIVLWAGIVVLLQFATLFVDVLTAITYVLALAYAASYYLHRGDHAADRRSRTMRAQS